MKPQDQLQIPVWSHEKEMLSGVLGTASFLGQMNCGWWSMSLENRSPRWKLPLVLSRCQLVFPEREIKEKKKNWKYFLGSSTRVKMLTKMSWGKQQAQHNTTQTQVQFVLLLYNDVFCHKLPTNDSCTYSQNKESIDNNGCLDSRMSTNWPM